MSKLNPRRVNKFAGPCDVCGENVPEKKGRFIQLNHSGQFSRTPVWAVRHNGCKKAMPVRPVRPTVESGKGGNG